MNGNKMYKVMTALPHDSQIKIDCCPSNCQLLLIKTVNNTFIGWKLISVSKFFFHFHFQTARVIVNFYKFDIDWPGNVKFGYWTLEKILWSSICRLSEWKRLTWGNDWLEKSTKSNAKNQLARAVKVRIHHRGLHSQISKSLREFWKQPNRDKNGDLS